MARRYSLDERPMPGGSAEPRFNPEFGGERINARLGPQRPRPLVRETSSGSISEQGVNQRRRLIGLPPRFDKS